jgi:hypothetical protein
MRRKFLTTALVGGVVAGGAWLAMPVGAAVVLADGCSTTAPTAGPNQLPVGGGDPTVFGDQGADQTSGQAGIVGSHGYLYASGSSNGFTVQGHQTESGVNGSATVSSSPTVCPPNTK